MVANPSWDPNGAWTNVLDDGDPWTTIPAHWDQGWFGASGITAPVNSGSPSNNSANLAISGGVLNMTVGNISGTPYGCLLTTNPANSATSTGLTFTPPYAVEAQINIPGPVNGGVPDWFAWWTNGQNWPADGEVDVLETIGNAGSDNVPHVHDATNPNGIGLDSLAPSAYGKTSTSGLHTFGCSRTATQVQFYYDGVLVLTEPIDTASPHYLVLVATYSTAQSLPQTMGVHWVRAWTPGTATTTGMTVSATASGSQAAAGVALTLRVLTGAATTQAGVTAHNEALSTPVMSLTPAKTGSVIYGAMTNGAIAAPFTARDAATTFFQNIGDTTTAESYLTFRGTATAVAGTAVTLGASGPAPVSQLLGVLAELQPATGQSIAEDPSSPPSVFADALTATTAGFSPPGGSVLVALVSANYGSAGTPTVTMTVSDSTGLTWTQLIGNSGAGGQNLCSVWVAGAGTGSPPPPIPGPPATARQLILSAAPRSGTDVYGNTFVQGIQVGPASGSQVLIRPATGAAEIQFPVPAPQLSNTANIAGGSTATLAQLVLSGPALAAASHQDWAQLVAFSSDGANPAVFQFRYISTSGAVTVMATFDGTSFRWVDEPWASLGSYPSGTTTRGRYRMTGDGELELDINLTGTPSSGSANFPNTLPTAYRPSVTKRGVIAQGGTLGLLSVSTAGVVSMTIGAGGSATADFAGRFSLS